MATRRATVLEPLIVFWARPVVASGLRWARHDAVFRDPDVALDELRGLGRPSEPCVLRVDAEPPQAEVVFRGDWLCDGSSPLPPRRLPAPGPGTAWRFSRASLRWARARPWLEAWELCRDGRWLAHAAATVASHIPSRRRLLLGALAACVRAEVSPSRRGVAWRHLDLVERWSHSEAAVTRRELEAAESSIGAEAPVAERDFVAESVHTLLDLAMGDAPPKDAAFALNSAADAAGWRGDPERAFYARCARIFRAHFPTIEVLRSVVRESAEEMFAARSATR